MRGLYLITNDDPIDLLLQKIDAALSTGQVALLQYRRKKVVAEQQIYELNQIKRLCQRYQTPLLVNDDLALAQQLGLGVHLGQGDGEITDAVQQLVSTAVIGRTCQGRLDWAHQAVAEGASYVAFGAIFPTSSKPEAACIPLALIETARAELDVPICVIGGMSLENAAAVIAAGADLCAVISDILALTPELIPARVNAWAELFKL